ncbi:MAG: acylphosphatase [Psychromonas sp.]|nr:acylphosphatase [Alteromonadales bacterium]MCP5077418.1 acylphosphatase [Psychromonas sp.]
MDKTGYKVIVSGLVQGVGFRYFTAKEANRLNIYGHAKNLNDGSVEVLMFGSKTQLHILLTWLENGPKTSVVDDIVVTETVYIHKESFLCL